jgi:hypothetical protein
VIMKTLPPNSGVKVFMIIPEPFHLSPSTSGWPGGRYTAGPRIATYAVLTPEWGS